MQGFDGYATDNRVGVHYDMPAREYHDDQDGPRLSQSICKQIVQKSPIHGWQCHRLLGGVPWEPSDDDGTIIHSLILEPDSGAIEEIDPATILTKKGEPSKTPLATEEGKAAVERALASGRIPLLTPKLDMYRYKAKALTQRFATCGWELAPEARREVVIYWEEDGVKCRTRLDYLHVTHDWIEIVDLKTCDSAHPDDIQASVWRHGYDIQRAAQVRAVLHAWPEYEGRVSHLFAFAELAKPYACNVVELDGEFIALGEQRWLRGRDKWAECLREDKWPSYEARRIAPPPWAMTKEMGL